MRYSLTLVGYAKKDPVGNFEEKVVIRLIDKNVNSALKRAQKLIKRDNWLVAEVVELEESNEHTR